MDKKEKEEEPRKKKPYKRPEIVYREKIEARAGACAKATTPCNTGMPPAS